MSILLILSLFVIWLAWTPGTVSYVDPKVGVMLLLAGFAALVLLTRILNRRALLGRGFDRVDHAVRGFNGRMTFARLFIPAWFTAGVFAFGWGDTAHRLLGPVGQPWLELPGVLVGLLPPMLAWTGLWWSQFELDRALREQNLLAQLDRDMPVFAPSRLGSHIINKLRTQILFTTVPLLLILFLHDVTALSLRALAGTPAGQRMGVSLPMTDAVESVVSLASAGLVFLFSPVLLRRVLHTQRLADSPLRQRLEMLCSATGLKCRDILLWRTQNNMGNAAVMGIVAPVRYVMLSDLLLATLSDAQIEAVFAHELGHVRHRHLAWFLAFFTGMSAILFGLGDFADRLLGSHMPQGQWVDLTTGILSGGAVLLGFGALSRRFERQADVYAARLIEHTAGEGAVAPPPPLSPAGPLGSHVFASALERIAVVNNISIIAPNWTHGSIATRMRFIRRLGRNPDETARFDHQIKRLRRILIIGMLLGIAATAWGWLRPPQHGLASSDSTASPPWDSAELPRP